MVTLFTHPNNYPYDSGLIISDKDMSVQSWLAKEDVRPTYYKNRVNAGLHVIDPKVLDMVSIDADKIGTVDEMTGKTVKVDLDRQLLKPLAGTDKMFCYDSPEYVKNMGTEYGNSGWYGMTYHEDVVAVKDSFKKMLENGVYKADLFSDL